MVLTLFIVVTFVDYFVILHTKIEFDILSQQYFWICEQNVGLSNEEKLDFENKLIIKGFENIEISAPLHGTISRGETIKYTIKSTKELSRRTTLFLSNKEDIILQYDRESISRRIVN